MVAAYVEQMAMPVAIQEALSMTSGHVGVVASVMLVSMMLAMCAKKRRVAKPRTEVAQPLSEVAVHPPSADNTQHGDSTQQVAVQAQGPAPVADNTSVCTNPAGTEKYMQMYGFSSIKTDLLEDKMEKMSERQGFFSEFDLIEAEELKFPRDISLTTAAQEAGPTKNRYANVVAKDWSRVKLHTEQNDEEYINANYVNGYKRKNAYICAQAPVSNGIEDFWAMIWQQNVKVVLMLAQLIEGGKEKCSRYWPESIGETMNFGAYSIKYVRNDEQDDDTYTRRLLMVTDKNGDTRSVWQLHYSAWPDHGLPDFNESVFAMIRDKDVYNSDTGNAKGREGAIPPVLVHCSAGIGRSGVMICVDIALRQLKSDGMIDIFNIVLDMRKQRSGMVQRSTQYKYCYEAVLDYSKKEMGNVAEEQGEMEKAKMDEARAEVHAGKEKAKVEELLGVKENVKVDEVLGEQKVEAVHEDKKRAKVEEVLGEQEKAKEEVHDDKERAKLEEKCGEQEQANVEEVHDDKERAKMGEVIEKGKSEGESTTAEQLIET
eukprot:CFRG4633T1